MGGVKEGTMQKPIPLRKEEVSVRLELTADDLIQQTQRVNTNLPSRVDGTHFNQRQAL